MTPFKVGNFYGDILGLVTALGLAVGAVTIRSAKDKNLIPAAVVGKLFVALFALLFIESFAINNSDINYCSSNVYYVCCYTFCFGDHCSKIYTCC